ncbi:MAG: alkaline phosphatase family protein, partial [Chitinophagaceae bacterium]
LNEYFRKQSSIVDIMPTIARFMDIRIPSAMAKEVDGVPLMGKLSVTNPSVNYTNGKATIRWKAMEKTGKAKIWVATNNNFKTGGKDEYHLLKEVPLVSQQAVIDLQKFPSSFYKIVVEGKNNSAGRWVTTGTN